MKQRTKQWFSDRDDHQRSAHHFPAGTEILDVGLDHVQQQGRVQWKVELLQVNELHRSHKTFTRETADQFQLTIH